MENWFWPRRNMRFKKIHFFRIIVCYVQKTFVIELFMMKVSGKKFNRMIFSLHC